MQPFDSIIYAMTLFVKFVTFLFALGYILICSIIFFAMYGIYLFMNDVLYGINLVIYGLNVIVTPIADFFNRIPRDINSGINAIVDFFNGLIKAAEEAFNKAGNEIKSWLS